MSNSIGALPHANTTATSGQTSQGTSAATGGVSANEGTFLTLLVSQLKNQDPLNPTDSTQFVSELAQFSSLEQLININQNVGTMTTTVSGAGSASNASNALTGGAGSTGTVPGATQNSDYNSLLNSIG
jgi:flagellar basal-body rod modification protein FlgD